MQFIFNLVFKKRTIAFVIMNFDYCNQFSKFITAILKPIPLAEPGDYENLT